MISLKHIKLVFIGVFVSLSIFSAFLPSATFASAPTRGCESKGFAPNEAIYTAIGCIPIKDNTELMTYLLRWAIGIAGGIALFFILYASFLIATSAGDPKKIQGGKELLVSSITGLLMLTLSGFVLRVIGIDILGLQF